VAIAHLPHPEEAQSAVSKDASCQSNPAYFIA
jgi:hypothetical protein